MQFNWKIYAYTFAFAPLVSVIIYIKYMLDHNKNFQAKQQVRMKKMFKFMKKIPFLSREVETIYNTFVLMGLSTDDGIIVVKTMKTFFTASSIVVISPFVGLLLKRDIVIVLLTTVLGMAVYSYIVNSSLNATSTAITKELANTMDEIERNYQKYSSLSMAVDKMHPADCLKNAFKGIYNILTQPESLINLNRFIETYPVPLVCTLATTLYIVDNFDNPVLVSGETALSRDISVLVNECNDNVQNDLRKQKGIGAVVYAPFIALVVWAVCEWYCLTKLPGTSKYINGTYGIVVHVAIVLLVLVAFKYLSSMATTSVLRQSDSSSVAVELLGISRIRKFIRSIIPKKKKNVDKLKNMLRNSSSFQTLEELYVKKIMWSVGVFIMAMIILAFSTIGMRYYFKDYYGSLTLIPQQLTPNQEIQIKRLDTYVMSLSEEEFTELEEDSVKFRQVVKGRMSGMTDSDADLQVQRLTIKYWSYHKSVYKWYWWLIAFGAAIVAWNVPNISLKLRLKSVQAMQHEEVQQLQTLAIVLGDSAISTRDFLGYLGRQAVLFKQPLLEAYYSYNDTQQVFDKLKGITDDIDFIHIIERLESTVGSLTLEEAFTSMTVEKRQSLSERKIIAEAKVQGDSKIASMIAIYVPLIALVLTMVLPIILAGFGTLNSSMSGLNTL